MKKKFIFTIILLMIPILVNAKVKIGDTQYETLDQAVAEAKEGDTIILLDDVDVTDTTKYKTYHNWLFPANTTLDLNGHTIITGRINGTTNSVWLGDNLTIKNGSFISKYKVNNSEDYYEADYALFVGDEIETSNIILENLSVSTGINIYNTLNVTLRNVTSIGRTYYAVWLDEHATVTIESGNYSSNGVAVVGVTSTEDYVSELTIKGGVFKANKGKLSLSEGGNPKYYPPIVKGGTFDFDVTEFLDENHECKENNGKYIVVDKQFDRDVSLDSGIEDFEIKVDNNKISQILIDTINSTEEVKVNDKDVNITLNVEKIKPEQDIIKNMNEKIKEANILNYFDIAINVIDKKSNKKIGNLTKLNEKISFSIAVPEDVELKNGYTRKYYILREHNGVIDILEPIISKDNKTLTFETDQFSTYALAYIDEKTSEIENPNTGDNIFNDCLIAGFLIINIVGCTLYLNKKKLFNK